MPSVCSGFGFKEIFRNLPKNTNRLPRDILVEDDCRSIGGADEMTITHVRPEIKTKIKSIVVEEFRGIDNLSDNIINLAT